MSLFTELKRRNVFRVGVAYAVAAWVLLQVFDVIGEILELPPDGLLPVRASADGSSAESVLSFGFAPGGSYGDRVLLDLAALLGSLGPIGLGRPSSFPTSSRCLRIPKTALCRPSATGSFPLPEYSFTRRAS